MRIALRHPPSNAPGEAFKYSNTQYYLAAMMVERATGESYGDVLDRLILRPHDLPRTLLPTTQTVIPGPHPVHYSRLYAEDPAGRLYDASESKETTAWSAGGMIPSTGDMLTFFSALFSGRILNPAQMQSSSAAPNTPVDRGAGHAPYAYAMLIVRRCRAAGLDVTEGDAMLLEMSVFTALTTGVRQDAAGWVRTAMGASP
ncbi:serine hydrolase [Spongiactinospora sp. 9N601]|uniref:serine hydrolase n=1 Tax=Spongiactinospora sp. 9N601 TaxID=3375149 RepID=UPI0037AA5E09